MVAAALTLWVERRLVVREWDCFCLGTAMARQASRLPMPSRCIVIARSCTHVHVARCFLASLGLATPADHPAACSLIELELRELGPARIRLGVVVVVGSGCVQDGTAHGAQAGAVLAAEDRPRQAERERIA